MSSEIVNQVVPVAACKPHPENYQQHDEGQIEDLRLSLKRFGQVRSIVVQDGGDDTFLILAGHGVHEAAQRQGLKDLRADVVPADWSAEKALAYVGADNELARRGLPDKAQLAALVVKVEEEAGAELARLAAGGELQAAMLKAQANLAEALEGMLDAPAADSSGRQLGEREKQIKPVLYVDDLADFERAIASTGMINRGEAMMEVCRFYLEHHGQSGTEGQ